MKRSMLTLCQRRHSPICPQWPLVPCVTVCLDPIRRSITMICVRATTWPTIKAIRASTRQTYFLQQRRQQPSTPSLIGSIDNQATIKPSLPPPQLNHNLRTKHNSRILDNQLLTWCSLKEQTLPSMMIRPKMAISHRLRTRPAKPTTAHSVAATGVNHSSEVNSCPGVLIMCRS
jgi:hypothetical protein